MKRLASCILLLSLCAMAQVKCIKEWTFDTAEKVARWSEKTNMVADVRCEDGVMKGTIMGWDPWLTGPQDGFTASQWQYLEIELKTDLGGNGQIYFTNTNESQYDGFFSDKVTGFHIEGDNQWHTYVVEPYWQFDRILKIRLDLTQSHDAANIGRRTFAVRRIRVMEPETADLPKTTADWRFSNTDAGWKAMGDSTVNVGAKGLSVKSASAETAAGIVVKPINFAIEDYGYWVVVEMAAENAEQATLSWASSASNGFRRKSFEIIPDGKMHFYNLDLSGDKNWEGDVHVLGLALEGKAASSSFTLKRLQVSEKPGGPVDLRVKVIGLVNALNRVGEECECMVRVTNLGGENAADLHIVKLELPEGVMLVPNSGGEEQQTALPFEPTDFFWKVKAVKPVSQTCKVTLGNAAGIRIDCDIPLSITPSLNLPKADYVPEPHPVDTGDYEIGALYFPGWNPRTHRGWAPIFARCPERKPVLGWYDESVAECIDWQIKWLVENGIKYLMVDWYWSKGHIGLEHWVETFYKTRYHKYLKWAMMWANHNAPGSHSEEDMVKVTKYWIEHYFKTPEYYTIDGKPVVMMWSVSNMDRDMKDKGGAKRLLEIANQIAKEAGLPGIHFSAMKWPEAEVKASTIQSLKDKGFESTSIYHYMGHGGKAVNPRRFPFELVAESNKDLWEAWYQTGILPFFTNLSTGWDDRPWNGGCEIYGRSNELFRKICQDAKVFADRTGVKKRILMSPLNEWGEGSYAEPNREFGFGMYEAVRDTFARKPAGGWPLNYGPQDVGLGPYDVVFPRKIRNQPRISWDFDDGSSQGWQNMMGLSDFKVEDKKLKLTTSSWDPAITVGLGRQKSSKFTKFVVRMKVSGKAGGGLEKTQLFWSTTTAAISEPLSVISSVPADGQFHDVVFDFTTNARYGGFLTSLRFDPVNTEKLEIEIDSMKLE